MLRNHKPNHSLLLMPVKLDEERWPKNKVRVLSCDAEGNLFTQFLGKTTYDRIRRGAEQMDCSHTKYATLYWEEGKNSYMPLYVEVDKNQVWALERITEHALRNAMIPDVLKKYPAEIIKLGEVRYKELVAERPAGTRGRSSSRSATGRSSTRRRRRS